MKYQNYRYNNKNKKKIQYNVDRVKNYMNIINNNNKYNK